MGKVADVTKPVFADLHKMPEDDRIRVIGESARTKRVGIALETTQPEKIERYKQKLADRYPDIWILEEQNLTTDVVILTYGPRPKNNA